MNVSPEVHTVPVGEPLESDYTVHELPTSHSQATASPLKSDVQLINRALRTRVELAEAEVKQLKKQETKVKKFSLESVQHDDNLLRFYTGFVSYSVFLAFFEFLGPVVNHLNYWGSKEGKHLRHRTSKLNPKNQFFLTLVKLKLNLKLTDLAFQFGLSISQTSRYITTWICFLYQHLKEINWMPTVNQVLATQPSAFKEKFLSTYAVIDGSEVFIETPL